MPNRRNLSRAQTSILQGFSLDAKGSQADLLLQHSAAVLRIGEGDWVHAQTYHWATTSAINYGVVLNSSERHLNKGVPSTHSAQAPPAFNRQLHGSQCHLYRRQIRFW